MIMYIPVTQKGKVDTTRKVLSEGAYLKKLDEERSRYAARLQVIKDDLTDTYNWVKNKREEAITDETISKHGNNAYTISFPFSIALNCVSISFSGKTKTDAINTFLENMETTIKSKDTLLEDIISKYSGKYVKMEADVPVELEEDTDEILCITGEELNQKFDKYRRNPEVDSSDLQTIPTNSDPNADIPDYMKIKSDGTITGIKEQR